ncbi:MAG: hypothetical protein PF450_05300 [Bacteroidales bacterium]|jgi:hypothetical protein|nr:hypothetical protein [Bacteroidales bacterium]
MRQISFLIILFCYSSLSVKGQSVVSLLATYGNMSGKECIDDDFSQTIFFVVPESFSEDFYLRIFDPDCGGEYDLSNGLWETNTIFEIFGGLGCVSEFDARQIQPQGNYKSGIVLDRALFAKESIIDGTWISFGPFKTDQGERLDEYPGYTFFKTIVEGRTGDDTNLYSLFVSSTTESNVAISNVIFFEYERTYLDGQKISVNRFDTEMLSDNELALPVELATIHVDSDYNIIVEPIEE